LAGRFFNWFCDTSDAQPLSLLELGLSQGRWPFFAAFYRLPTAPHRSFVGQPQNVSNDWCFAVPDNFEREPPVFNIGHFFGNGFSG